MWIFRDKENVRNVSLLHSTILSGLSAIYEDILYYPQKYIFIQKMRNKIYIFL